MRAALYLRVSTLDQTTQNQEIILTEYCARQQIEIYKIYKDEGISGSQTSRKALDEMLQDMRDLKFDAVIIWKLDRLGRSLTHLLQLLQEFQNMKVRLIITDMALDTDTPQGKFFFMMMGAMAEFERELIRERILAGVKRRRLKGLPNGRPPGSKDKAPRNKLGYWKRWSLGRKKHPPVVLPVPAEGNKGINKEVVVNADTDNRHDGQT